jgi:hypothetical protein
MASKRAYIVPGDAPHTHALVQAMGLLRRRAILGEAVLGHRDIKIAGPSVSLRYLDELNQAINFSASLKPGLGDGGNVAYRIAARQVAQSTDLGALYARAIALNLVTQQLYKTSRQSGAAQRIDTSAGSEWYTQDQLRPMARATQVHEDMVRKAIEKQLRH